MKLLAFGASNSRHSINAKLAHYAAERFRNQHQPDAEIERIDLNDYEMPLYSIDREHADGIPDAAHEIFSKIGAADALIIAFAEHNGLYTVAWKNIFDWVSRIDQKVYQNTPMVGLSTSPGGRGGQTVLQIMQTGAPYFGGNILGSHSVASWHQAYDERTQTLTQDADIIAIDKALTALQAALA